MRINFTLGSRQRNVDCAHQGTAKSLRPLFNPILVRASWFVLVLTWRLMLSLYSGRQPFQRLTMLITLWTWISLWSRPSETWRRAFLPWLFLSGYSGLALASLMQCPSCTHGRVCSLSVLRLGHLCWIFKIHDTTIYGCFLCMTCIMPCMTSWVYLR